MKSVQFLGFIKKINDHDDNSASLNIETPELNNIEMGALRDLKKKNLTITLVPLDEPADEILEITSEAEPKSRSQKLRSVLYILWEQKYKEKYPTFTVFYDVKMDKLIDDIKDLLN